MAPLRLKFKKTDWILFGISLVFLVLGLFILYYSSLAQGNFLNFKKQLYFSILAVSLLILFMFFDYRIFKNNSFLILLLYFAAVLFLSGLFLFAPAIRGTRSWYKIGNIAFDPVEYTKIILIILLAKYFSMRHVEMYKITHICISGLYVLIPVVLIFLQPNFGSVIILVAIWLGVLMVSGIKLKHFFILFLIFSLLAVLSWIFLLRDYQKTRIVSFISPHLEPLGAGWNQRQAKITIGSGGLFGLGIKNGTQVRYGFLPEYQTDFVFANFAEGTGFLGISLIFFLYLALIGRIIKIAVLSKENFSRLFAAGFAISLSIQIIVNVGMNLGLLPIIGIPLPFLSYGGSGLIMNFIGLGILESIFRNNV